MKIYVCLPKKGSKVIPFTSGTYLYILYSTPRGRKEAIPSFLFPFFVCVCHAVYRRWEKQKLRMQVAPFKPQLVCSSCVELVERSFTYINCLVSYFWSKDWNKLKTHIARILFMIFSACLVSGNWSSPENYWKHFKIIQYCLGWRGAKKDYILPSSRFAVMFSRRILSTSWESLCGIINVGKKTVLCGNWGRSLYRFSTFFPWRFLILPVFHLSPVRACRPATP